MEKDDVKNRLSNSQGKCLLENWVEERAVQPIDGDLSRNEIVKKGHQGILSVEFDAKAENLTTVREAYKVPQPSGISGEGKRKETLMRLLYEEISKDVSSNFNAQQEPIEYKSEMMEHFGGRFHDSLLKDGNKNIPDSVYNEQPVTFWTENQNRITGVSQVKTGDTPFRKNAAFSKPISESFDQTHPYDIENYPKM